MGIVSPSTCFGASVTIPSGCEDFILLDSGEAVSTVGDYVVPTGRVMNFGLRFFCPK